MSNYVTIRRWARKPGNDEASLLTFVRDDLVPAWRKIGGCLSLNLLHIRESDSYLAVTYWDSKAAFDAWSGDPGRPWRDEHRAVLEKWLSMMTFQDEMDADLLVVG
jgi:heme-degrading monooxygenase HmoA